MRTESDFYHRFYLLLREKHIFAQRVESAETGCGIPDLYIRTLKREWWIELKNMPNSQLDQSHWTVPWRPGQQSWSQVYKKASGLNSVTLCALSDGFIWIPMTKRFQDNIVTRMDIVRMYKLRDVLELLE